MKDEYGKNKTNLFKVLCTNYSNIYNVTIILILRVLRIIRLFDISDGFQRSINLLLRIVRLTKS